jgi:hypothetical protein
MARMNSCGVTCAPTPNSFCASGEGSMLFALRE